MSLKTYSGNVPSALDLGSTRTVSLAGAGTVSGVITAVRASVGLSTNAYTVTWWVTVTIHYTGGSVSVTRNDIKFTSSNYSGAQFEFIFPVNFDVNSITGISLIGQGTSIYVKGAQSVGVEYGAEEPGGPGGGGGGGISGIVFAPRYPYFSPSYTDNVYETNPQLFWQDWSPTPFGDVEPSQYQISYRDSADGLAYGGLIYLKTFNVNKPVTREVTLPTTRGAYRKYFIRSEDGSGGVSGYTEVVPIRKNSIPSAPANVSISPSVYNSQPVTVSWPSAADADNNIVAYEVQRAITLDGITWGSFVNLNTNVAGNSLIDNPSLGRDHEAKYRVRAKDKFGITGEYAQSNSIGINKEPNPVIVNFPQPEKTTYNARPWFLITVGDDPNAQLMTLTLIGFSRSGPGPYESGDHLTLRKDNSSNPGDVIMAVTPVDSYDLAGEETTATTIYEPAAWADSMRGGFTQIKASQMTELRDKINTVRNYYGMEDAVWSEAIEPGRTSLLRWPAHIAEMRNAISEIIGFINAWDVPVIALPAWIQITQKQPIASVMAQLRAAVETL